MRKPLRRICGHATSVAAILFSAQLHLLAQTSSGADRTDPASVTATQPTYYPMTETQRFKQYLADTANPLSLVTAAAAAGIGQLHDRPSEWQQGARGYGLRYGSAYAEHIVNQTLLFSAGSLLHEDNRYVPSGESGFGRRLTYAIESTFLARGDDGRRHFSFSRVAALAGSALISRLWQPPSTNSLSSAGANFGTSVGAAVGFQVFHEFWPHKW